jgi:hypothetical protein
MEAKKYYIKTWHDVQEYSHEDGELDHVNAYDMSDIIKANDPKEAIDKYINKVLGYMFDVDEIEVDESIYFDVLVDKNNMQASPQQVEAWKDGKIKLYNDYVNMEIYELNQITEL